MKELAISIAIVLLLAGCTSLSDYLSAKYTRIAKIVLMDGSVLEIEGVKRHHQDIIGLDLCMVIEDQRGKEYMIQMSDIFYFRVYRKRVN